MLLSGIELQQFTLVKQATRQGKSLTAADVTHGVRFITTDTLLLTLHAPCLFNDAVASTNVE
jgi:hypothetical protein